MTTPPTDPKVLNHPEYRRVYDHYVAHGLTGEDAARRAYEHTVWHVARPPQQTKHPVIVTLVILGIALAIWFVFLVLPIRAAFS
jgi:hypothetical protein